MKINLDKREFLRRVHNYHPLIIPTMYKGKVHYCIRGISHCLLPVTVENSLVLLENKCLSYPPFSSELLSKYHSIGSENVDVTRD